MREKSILFVVLSLGNGGVERVITHLANGFVQRGVRVGIFTLLPNGDYSQLLDPRVTTYCYGRKVSGLLNKIRGAKYLASVSKEYDRVLSGLFIYGLEVVFLSKVMNALCGHKSTQYIIRIGTCLSGIPEFMRRFSRRVDFIYPRMDGIISVSKGIERDTEHVLRGRVKKHTTIYNPLDSELIGRKAAELVPDAPSSFFVNAGRLAAQKDQATLIRGFSRFLQLTGRQDYHLLILGRGGKEQALKKLATELGLLNSVHFMGFVDNPWKYMRHSTAFVLSSRWEGFPNVVLEAMACGTPVIATDCPTGPAELLQQGKNGFLVPMGTPEEMARAMVAVVTSPEVVQQKVANAYRFIQSLNVPTIVEEYELALFP